MNNKEDISLIKKYINGEDLGEISVEELENNKDFMKEVIEHTNDYKIYNLCSDNVKKDYEFINYLINKFPNNYKFIDNVAKIYFDKSDNELNKKELKLIMENILPDVLAKKYKRCNYQQYLDDREEMENLYLSNPLLEDEIGMGFSKLYEKYSNSKMIIEYYVKHLIDDIVNDVDDLKYYLLEEFKDGKSFNTYEMTNYIIGYIGFYDKALSIYISKNTDAIKDVINSAIELQNRFYKEKEQRFSDMFDMVNEYINYSDSKLFAVETIFYIARELGITDKIEEHYKRKFIVPDTEEFDKYFEDEIDLSIKEEDIDYEFAESEIYDSEESKRDYLNIKKIMENQLFTYNELDVYSLINNKQKTLNKNYFEEEDNNN